VDRAPDFLFGQGDDHSLDLPPVAEAHDIALVAAVLGARRGLEPGVVAKGFDQQGRIGQGRPASDEGHVHGRPANPPLVELWSTDAVNEAVTMIFVCRRLAGAVPEAHGPVMTRRRSPAAGGIFLFLGPVIGAIYGVEVGEPIIWMLAGFAIGVAIALAIWLIDRRKG